MEPENSSLRPGRPNLPKRLFWDWRYEAIDWEKMSVSVIARVLERGSQEEIDELIRFYGRGRVVHALLNDITYLPEYVVAETAKRFDLKKEDLACRTRRQPWRKGHWI